jgi:hypothetical protein
VSELVARRGSLDPVRQRALHRHGVLLVVDVSPAERPQLSQSQAQVRRHAHQLAVLLVRERLRELLDLVHGVGLKARRLSQLARLACLRRVGVGQVEAAGGLERVRVDGAIESTSAGVTSSAGRLPIAGQDRVQPPDASHELKGFKLPAIWAGRLAEQLGSAVDVG